MMLKWWNDCNEWMLTGPNTEKEWFETGRRDGKTCENRGGAQEAGHAQTLAQCWGGSIQPFDNILKLGRSFHLRNDSKMRIESNST